MLKKIIFGAGFSSSIPGYFFDRCDSLTEICFVDGEDAVSLISCSTNNNGVYTKATIVSEAEYVALSEKSGSYIIYDCTPCFLFNNGIHTPSQNKTVVGNDFFAPIKIACLCSVEGCGAAMEAGEIAPMFKNEIGYSAKMFGDDLALVCGYRLNREAITEYMTYATDFSFGIVAAVNAGGEEFAPNPKGGNGVVDIVFNNMANDYVEVKLTGVPDTERNTLIVFCAYVTVDGKCYYLENGVTADKVLGVCYNDFAE